MKKHVLIVALVSVPSAALYAQERVDPVLTEKTRASFDVDFDGCKLSLPKELRKFAKVEVQDENTTSFSVGNVRVDYKIPAKDDGEAKKVTGWFELSGVKHPCTLEKALGDIATAARSNSGLHYVLSDVKAGEDHVYLVTADQFRGDRLKGLRYTLIDQAKAACYFLSLAMGDFGDSTLDEIKQSVKPLSQTIEKSLRDYIK